MVGAEVDVVNFEMGEDGLMDNDTMKDGRSHSCAQVEICHNGGHFRTRRWWSRRPKEGVSRKKLMLNA